MSALRTQAARISQNEGISVALAVQILQLNAQLQNLQQPAPAMQPPPTDGAISREGVGIRLAPPERFSGEPGQCKAFLTNCSIHFEYSPQVFTSDRSKVAFMVSYLTGQARAWVTAEWGRDSPLCLELHDFQEALKKTFNPVTTDRENARELCGLQQGGSSVCDHGIQFRTLAAESDWNNAALYDIFLKSLSLPIQERLLPLDLPTDLDSLIALAI